MRGAPQCGFSATIWKVNSRICLEILRPPPTRFRTLQSMAQYSLNSSLVPPNDSFRQDEKQHLLPLRPEAAREHPKQLIEWPQLRPRMFAFQDGKLLPESEVF